MTALTTQAPPARSTSVGLGRFLPHSLIALFVAGATSYVWAVDPSSEGAYPLCPTFALAGIYCPGCGLLRATHELSHLDLAGAIAFNPLAVPLYLGVGLLFLVWVRATWRRQPIRWDPPTWLPAALAIGFVVFTIARNVPGWSWLSPA